MRKIFIIALFVSAFTPIALSADFDFWKELYKYAAKPEYNTDVRVSRSENPRNILGFDFPVVDSLKPFKVASASFDGADVKSAATILNRHEDNKIFTRICYGPAERLKNGWHLFKVEGYVASEKWILMQMLLVDPDLVANRKYQESEVVKIFFGLKNKKDRFDNMDCDFTLQIDTKKRNKKLSEFYQGRYSSNGGRSFTSRFTAEPVIRINGKLVPEDKKWEDPFNDGERISLLKLYPFSPAYNIFCRELAEYYGWAIHKKIGNRIWLWGTASLTDPRIPRFIEMVIDKKTYLPLEINSFIYYKEFIAASAKIEYNDKNLPVQQTLIRLLPDGREETSVFELSGHEVNKRSAPRKGSLL